MREGARSLARSWGKESRVCGRQVNIWGSRAVLSSCDRHCGGTICVERKRMPKTNLVSVTILPKLNSKGRFSTSVKRRRLRSSEYTFLLPKDWSCVFYNHKKKKIHSKLQCQTIEDG